MNYGITTYIYGPSKLGLKYDTEKLNELIDNYIDNNNEFSFSQLCRHILSVADQEDMLNKQPHTSYSQIYLTHNDMIRINKNLWERIWAREILILFNSEQDINQRTEETYFIANK